MDTVVISGDTETVGPTTLSPVSSCMNIHHSDSDCTLWASVGHCDINPGYMLKNCAKACRSCDAVTIETSTPPLITVSTPTTTTVRPPPSGIQAGISH